jgi:hypothetical protein
VRYVKRAFVENRGYTSTLPVQRQAIPRKVPGISDWVVYEDFVAIPFVWKVASPRADNPHLVAAFNTLHVMEFNCQRCFGFPSLGARVVLVNFAIQASSTKEVALAIDHGEAGLVPSTGFSNRSDRFPAYRVRMKAILV